MRIDGHTLPMHRLSSAGAASQTVPFAVTPWRSPSKYRYQ